MYKLISSIDSLDLCIKEVIKENKFYLLETDFDYIGYTKPFIPNNDFLFYEFIDFEGKFNPCYMEKNNSLLLVGSVPMKNFRFDVLTHKLESTIREFKDCLWSGHCIIEPRLPVYVDNGALVGYDGPRKVIMDCTFTTIQDSIVFLAYVNLKDAPPMPECLGTNRSIRSSMDLEDNDIEVFKDKIIQTVQELYYD